MNSSTALARDVVATLVEAGVVEAVLSPGSRNAPLAFALHDAAAAGLLRLHTRVDERSAAFTALSSTSGRGVPSCPSSASVTAAASSVLVPATSMRCTANNGLYAAPTVPSTSSATDDATPIHSIRRRRWRTVNRRTSARSARRRLREARQTSRRCQRPGVGSGSRAGGSGVGCGGSPGRSGMIGAAASPSTAGRLGRDSAGGGGNG